MPLKMQTTKTKGTQKVIPAPNWLASRMEILQRMPPPTLKDVATHLKASAEIRKRLTAKQPA